MRILLASNNKGKLERYQNLLKQTNLNIELITPDSLGILPIETEEIGTSLRENAELKARAYFGKTNLPILSNDTGFYVEGEGLIDTPKRMALGKTHENTFTESELYEKMISFWKGIASKHGGKVDAAWVETFVLLYPDGSIKIADARREVTLTDQILGEAHINMPVRALYYSKATSKPAVTHTKEEELLEMKPIIGALKKLIGK